MGGTDNARAHGQGTAAYGAGVEEVQRHATPDHVYYGVHGPDLVERYFFRSLVVDGALGDGQTSEGIHCAQGGPLREVGTSYQDANVSESPVEGLVRVTYVCPERGDVAYFDAFGGEVEGYAEAV